jgi:hypothetical protein
MTGRRGGSFMVRGEGMVCTAVFCFHSFSCMLVCNGFDLEFEWVFGCLGFVVELSIGDGDAHRRGLLWWLIGMGRF